MAEQTCKDCRGRGSWSDMDMDFICPTCDGDGAIYRVGPYRLKGTPGKPWSDGIDRTKRIDLRQVTDRYEVTVRPGYFHVWHSTGQPADFYSFAEAIRYADHHARTTKNGDAQ